MGPPPCNMGIYGDNGKENGSCPFGLGVYGCNSDYKVQ